ncbi:MAG: transcriptional regulator [Spirochaetota bacterium]
MGDFVQVTARDDFNKARTQAKISRLINALTPQNQELLSLRDVTDVVRPHSETYKGLQAVDVRRIVGSEGRYNDFNKGFLPRRETLRGRWQSIDRAHLQQVNLPVIRLYEIGGVYFVRDGNHRVSVARAQGVMSIDAEVVSLGTEIKLDPEMTKADLKNAVINYEKERFYERTQWPQVIPRYDLVFTEVGRYDVVLQHVEGHKYFLNQHYSEELSFQQALQSWFNNVFKPIVDVIAYERILARFPGRTAADLYMWIVKHWDELKKQYGEDYPVQEAARDFSSRFGKSLWRRVWEWVGERTRRT